ncbi:hypothetical protein V9T40_007892 [Parthenolecanium corni]|uniref:Uncharacterized protein n=1 Tax=Parthenolecanium corni TaxID=536013 RepID=A0AAN9Y5E5_9HEMI
MIGVPNLRPVQCTNGTKGFQCHPKGETEATIILNLTLLGMVTNAIMMSLILINKHLRRIPGSIASAHCSSIIRSYVAVLSSNHATQPNA